MKFPVVHPSGGQASTSCSGQQIIISYLATSDATCCDAQHSRHGNRLIRLTEGKFHDFEVIHCPKLPQLCSATAHSALSGKEKLLMAPAALKPCRPLRWSGWKSYSKVAIGINRTHHNGYITSRVMKNATLKTMKRKSHKCWYLA